MGFLMRGALVVVLVAVIAAYLVSSRGKGCTLCKTPVEDSYDYIVVGSGPAGAVVATRLSRQPGIRVLLLEAGPDDNDPQLAIPAATGMLHKIGKNGFPGGEASWRWKDAADKRHWLSGKVLGGGSTVNSMFWVRGNSADYDRWESHFGCKGWNSTAVLKYFKMIERVEGNSPARGHIGPITISPAKEEMESPFVQAAFQACISAGMPRTVDYNSLSYPFAQDGTSIVERNIDEKGKRCGAPEAYLRPRLALQQQGKNTSEALGHLAVRTNAHVRRVIFEGKTAVGVEVSLGAEEAVRKVRATKEVILSAGAIGSPHLLMVSGVGPAAHLKEHGVEVVADIPAVGQNLQDHVGVVMSHSLVPPHHLRFTQKFASTITSIGKYLLFGTGPLATNFFTALSFFRTIPDLEQPNIQIHWGTWSIGNGPEDWEYPREEFENILHPEEEESGLAALIVLLHPYSVGNVSLQGSDPQLSPAIYPNYLQDKRDLDALVAAMKKAREVYGQEGVKSYLDKEHTHKELREKYGKGLNYLENYVRRLRRTVYHPAGTCRCGALGDPKAVVDSELRVQGVKNLRVVDASIMPEVISGNTNAPTFMIGEKGAAMILNDLHKSQK